MRERILERIYCDVYMCVCVSECVHLIEGDAERVCGEDDNERTTQITEPLKVFRPEVGGRRRTYIQINSKRILNQ